MRRGRAIAAAVWLAAVGSLVVAGGYVYYRTFRPDPRRYPVQGIDVSHHQGPIRWRDVAASGIAFAYIKATEGNSFRDAAFVANWKGAKEAGVTRGAYHFYSLCKSAVAQVRNFIAAVPVTPDALPPALDLEFGGNCTIRPDAVTVRDELQLYSNSIAATYGTRPVLYVTREFLDVYGSVLPDHRGIWFRSVAFAPRPFERRWLFWQFHNRGHIVGIDGPVDRNVFAGSREAFNRYAAARDGVGVSAH